MKRFALLMSVLTLFASQAWVFGASHEDAKGPKGSATAVKPEKKTEKKNTEKKTANSKTIPVPEPTTITLLGAAAGVAVARKLWRNRQR